MSTSVREILVTQANSVEIHVVDTLVLVEGKFEFVFLDSNETQMYRGYMEGGDGGCNDINECSINDGTCANECSNFSGGYSCGCQNRAFKVGNR